MIKLIASITIGVLLTTFNVNAQTYKVDVSTSSLEWKSTKVTGEHFGKVKIQSGNVIVSNGKISGGEFIIDMKGISVTDTDDKDKSNWDFSYFERIKHEVNAHLTKYFEDTRFPMLPQRLVNIVRKELPEDSIVTLDNGVYKIWFARNYKCYNRNSLLLDNALATMGAGLLSAMLAKLITLTVK